MCGGVSALTKFPFVRYLCIPIKIEFHSVFYSLIYIWVMEMKKTVWKKNARWNQRKKNWIVARTRSTDVEFINSIWHLVNKIYWSEHCWYVAKVQKCLISWNWIVETFWIFCGNEVLLQLFVIRQWVHKIAVNFPCNSACTFI